MLKVKLYNAPVAFMHCSRNVTDRFLSRQWELWQPELKRTRQQGLDLARGMLGLREFLIDTIRKVNLKILVSGKVYLSFNFILQTDRRTLQL